MHIKTNIETNVVHLALLAMCPLLLFINTALYAIGYLLVTAICLLFSTLICNALNKYLDKNIKIFVTAIISTIIVTLLQLLLSKFKFWWMPNNETLFYAVLSAVILSIDTYFIATKALVGNVFIKLLLTLAAFASIIVPYSIIREIFGNGSFFNIAIPIMPEIEFFSSIAFDLILLGVIGVVAEIIYHTFTKWYSSRKIAYQKFVKMVRNEKEFQYDKLRCDKLLVSPGEINHATDEEMQTIADRSNENLVAIEEKQEEVEEDDDEPKKKRRNKKLKFSKETKEEKVYDQSKKYEGEDGDK